MGLRLQLNEGRDPRQDSIPVRSALLVGFDRVGSLPSLESREKMMLTRHEAAQVFLCGIVVAFSVVVAVSAEPFQDGISAYKRGDYAAALEIFRPLAEEGNAKAQANLGLMYYKGEGVPQDYAEAAKWYRRAAEQGITKAQFNLGLMYAKGIGVTRDHGEAANWYRKAADQGVAEAQYNLGVMYAKGEGVPQDYAEAMTWYHRAAEQGIANAQYNLGLMYENGQGVQQDYPEAMTWYRKAADHGDAEAQDDLGYMYLFGKGVPEDDFEALNWYRKAADQGLASAQSSLGFIFELSESVPHDFKEAARWYQMAANQGDAYSQYAVGQLYRDGRGVSQDLSLAYKWFNRAAVNPDKSLRDHAVSALHSLSGKLPSEIDASLPPDPFGRNFEMIWPSGGVRAVFTWLLVTVVCGAGLWGFQVAKARKVLGRLWFLSSQPAKATPSREMPLSGPGKSAVQQQSIAHKIEVFFWILYILFPLFTGGWQAYNWLPNESYNSRIHELIASDEVCINWGLQCADRAERWRHNETGEIYTREDFADHRHAEALRGATTWFAYGVIGCFGFAFFRNLHERETFYDWLRKALFVNAVIAVFTLISWW
jgi:TPR repeat protein